MGNEKTISSFLISKFPVSREPLLHFLLLGGALFVLNAWRGGAQAVETVFISADDVTTAVALRESLLERSLTDAERDELIAGVVDEELLLREAYRIGLHRSDGRVRRQLLQKMQFLLAEEPSDPDPDTLRAWYEANADRYRVPVAVSVDHVYFPPDGEHAEDAPSRALERLEAGADHVAEGTPFWMGPTLREFTQRELVNLLGESFANAVFDLSPGTWSGPIESARGLHLVRVIERHPPRVPPFENVESYVRDDWKEDQRRAGLRAKLDEIRTDYRVVVDDPTPAPETGP